MKNEGVLFVKMDSFVFCIKVLRRGGVWGGEELLLKKFLPSP